MRAELDDFDHMGGRPNVREARDRILRDAFLIDLYPPIESFDILAMRERLAVDGSLLRVC